MRGSLASSLRSTPSSISALSGMTCLWRHLSQQRTFKGQSTCWEAHIHRYGPAGLSQDTAHDLQGIADTVGNESAGEPAWQGAQMAKPGWQL